MGAAPEASSHREERELRGVAADRAPLRDAVVAAGRRAGRSRRPQPEPGGSDRPRGACTAAPRSGQRTSMAEGAGEERPPSQAWSGWVSGKPGTSDAVGAVERAQDGIAHLGLVSVAVVVHAPVRQPHGRRADHGAGPSILLAPRPRRLALCLESAARVPPSRRRLRGRIAGEDGEQLDGRAAPRPRRHRRPEREHAVVQVRGDDDDPVSSARGWLGCGHDAV